MNKAILVIDMPESCYECCLRHHMTDNLPEDWCGINGKEVVLEAKDRPAWCPLKQIPEKKLTYITSSDYLNGFGSGYNACIDDIIGK